MDSTKTISKPIKVGTRVYVINMCYYCRAGYIKSIEDKSYIDDFHYNIELDNGEKIECEAYGINGRFGFHRQHSVFTDKDILNKVYNNKIRELKGDIRDYEEKIDTLKSL